MSARLSAVNPARSAQLLDALREHEAQAAVLRAAYGAAVAIDSGGMLYWIAEAARQLREGAGRKLVHPAASGNMDQSTLYRFERHDGQPTSIDATVAAYADDLDLHPIEIWERAFELWHAAIDAGAEEKADRVVDQIRAERTRVADDDRPPAKRSRTAADDRASATRSKASRRAR